MLTSGTKIQIRASGAQVCVDDLAIADLIYDPFQDAYCEVVDILQRTTFIDSSIGGSTSYKLRPVVIRAGAIGNKMPKNDITVSQAQCVFKAMKPMSKYMEVDFTAASMLVQSGTAELVRGKTKVIYFVIFTEQEAAIVANGLPVLSNALSKVDWSAKPASGRLS